MSGLAKFRQMKSGGLSDPDGHDGGVGHTGRAHRRLQVVGRHLGRRRHGALLSLELGLPAAAEEEGDVRVLLGLGQPELGSAGHTDHLTHRHRQVGLVVQHLDALEPVVVVGHGHIVQGEGGHAVVGEVLLRQGRRDLPAAVGAEVEAEDHVTRANPAVHALEDRRLDEFVGDVCRIGRRHGRLGVGEGLPLTVHEQRVLWRCAPIACRGP